MPGELPIDAVTLGEAAHICGCSTRTLWSQLHEAGMVGPGNRHRRYARADIEALALTMYPHRLPAKGAADSYWVTSTRAAAILGVNVSRLNQLVARGFIPYETHADGTRLYRREQLAVVANARAVRWSRYQSRGRAAPADG